jgi:hypothetical protein
MPRYAVYEVQKIMVVYYVDADSPEQAHDMVLDLGITEYDDFMEAIDADIDESKTEVETPDGWKKVEA